MEPLLIVTLIVSSLVLILGIVLLVVLLKRKNTSAVGADNSEALKDLEKEIYALSKSLGNISKEIQGDLEKKLSEEIIKLQEKQLDSNEVNNKRLLEFQDRLSESMEKRFTSLNEMVDKKLNDINKKVEERLNEGFKNSNETFTNVIERLSKIDEAQKNIEDLSKEVVGLKQIFDNNQSRGRYGEYQLEMVLNNVFGDTINTYKLQYTMKKVKDGDDVRADAAVFLPEPYKLICIDSKFPFKDYEKIFDGTSEDTEASKRDFAAAVKKHITTIKDKYIVEGKTFKQAIMFIPNDGVFAYIYHNLEDVVDYAREKNVILTSPSTLPAVLVTINMVRIETQRAKNLQEVSKQLTRLGKDFKMFNDEWTSFSRNLDLATRNKEKLDSRVDKITNKFDAINYSPEELGEGEKPDLLDSLNPNED